MLGDLLDRFSNFILLDPFILHTLITTLIYVLFLYLGLKGGSSSLTFLIGYILISMIFTFTGLKSLLNFIDLFELLWQVIKQPFSDFFNDIFKIFLTQLKFTT